LWPREGPGAAQASPGKRSLFNVYISFVVATSLQLYQAATTATWRVTSLCCQGWRLLLSFIFLLLKLGQQQHQCLTPPLGQARSSLESPGHTLGHQGVWLRFQLNVVLIGVQ
jgi:hypothetical protein